MNRNFSACNIKIDINNYKKDRTVCKSCFNENKNKRRNKNNTLPPENELITELTNDKQTKGKYHVTNYLKDILGFAKHHDNCTYGLGYKLALQRNSDNHVLVHPTQTNDAANLVLAGRVIIDDINWYVLH